MKDSIRTLIQHAVNQLTSEGILPEGLVANIQVENTRDKTHGDFASNIAMMTRVIKPTVTSPVISP